VSADAELEERVALLELQLEVACSTVTATLAEVRELRAEIRKALGRLIGETDR
jgi:hypothetical protein